MELAVHVTTQKIARSNLLKTSFATLEDLIRAFPSSKFLLDNKVAVEDIKKRLHSAVTGATNITRAPPGQNPGGGDVAHLHDDGGGGDGDGAVPVVENNGNIYKINLSTYAHTHIYATLTHTHTYTHTQTLKQTHTHTHTHTHTRTHTNTDVVNMEDEADRSVAAPPGSGAEKKSMLPVPQTRAQTNKALQEQIKLLQDQVQGQEDAVRAIIEASEPDEDGRSAAEALLTTYKRQLADFKIANPEVTVSQSAEPVPSGVDKAGDESSDEGAESLSDYESNKKASRKKTPGSDVDVTPDPEPLYNCFAMEELEPSGSSPRNQDIRAALNGFVGRVLRIVRDVFSNSTFPVIRAGDSVDGVFLDLESSNLPPW